MKVELLHYTPTEPLVKACIMPYQSKGGDQLIKRVWDSGHRSVARHGMASFEVVGVSQSLLAQLSRHPHINLTVQSSRYCNMQEGIENGVFPPFIKNEEYDILKSYYEIAAKTYEQLLESGEYTNEQYHEIAKLVLPKGSLVNLVISGNYQALYEFLQLRLCVRAEWEIRSLANMIRSELIEKIPVIFKDLDCKAKDYGVCLEHECCGKYPCK